MIGSECRSGASPGVAGEKQKHLREKEAAAHPRKLPRPADMASTCGQANSEARPRGLCQVNSRFLDVHSSRRGKLMTYRTFIFTLCWMGAVSVLGCSNSDD